MTIGGMPLGIRAEAGYESGSLQLQEGDWLLIFTDGLVEALNQREEDYGETRLLEVLHAGAAGTPDEMLRRMMAYVYSFVGPTPQPGDITYLLVKVG